MLFEEGNADNAVAEGEVLGMFRTKEAAWECAEKKATEFSREREKSESKQPRPE